MPALTECWFNVSDITASRLTQSNYLGSGPEVSAILRLPYIYHNRQLQERVRKQHPRQSEQMVKTAL